LSEGDVRSPKLFRQTVPQRWSGGGRTARLNSDRRRHELQNVKD